MFFSRERYGDITALLRLYGCVAATEWPECGDGFTAHGKTAVIEKKKFSRLGYCGCCGNLTLYMITGAAEPRRPGGQLTPLFQVRGPHMGLDPSFFVVFTCAQSVAVDIHSFNSTER